MRSFVTLGLILTCPIAICSNQNMKFRNYVPQDKQLQEGKLAPPVLPKFEDPAAAVPPPSEKKEVYNFILFYFFFTLPLLFLSLFSEFLV